MTRLTLATALLALASTAEALLVPMASSALRTPPQARGLPNLAFLAAGLGWDPPTVAFGCGHR